MPVPASNPLTPEKIEAGRRLFADTRLSRSGTIACTSCHDPERAFTKPEAVSPGVFGRRGHRNAPTLINRAWGRVFFWDGRAATLEEQVLMPIEDPNEMDLPLAEASVRVGQSIGEISRALASYVRSLMSGNSRFDRFTDGDARRSHPRSGTVCDSSRDVGTAPSVTKARTSLTRSCTTPGSRGRRQTNELERPGTFSTKAARPSADRCRLRAARSRHQRCGRLRALHRTCTTVHSRRSRKWSTSTIAAVDRTLTLIPTCIRSTSRTRTSDRSSPSCGRFRATPRQPRVDRPTRLNTSELQSQLGA